MYAIIHKPIKQYVHIHAHTLSAVNSLGMFLFFFSSLFIHSFSTHFFCLFLYIQIRNFNIFFFSLFSSFYSIFRRCLHYSHALTYIHINSGSGKNNTLKQNKRTSSTKQDLCLPHTHHALTLLNFSSEKSKIVLSSLGLCKSKPFLVWFFSSLWSVVLLQRSRTLFISYSVYVVFFKPKLSLFCIILRGWYFENISQIALVRSSFEEY